ncbi:hypothetical protein [Thioclava sp. DLFJ4-1]|uniref:hypothetical protein n=1 Tax=Thioclava sp. DLFJ4-1 TaxID=1915313 RepID=UPI00099635E4|nr:hypothetical protein [Thioclava sp. DLFJ4-1]OOY14420.1 hypothetical protein BMI85_20130 [Thioclava sp. DLFJ4-1]
MANKHPAPKDPSEVSREYDETRRRLDGPALMIAIPLLLVAIYFAFYGVDSGRSDIETAQMGTPAAEAGQVRPITAATSKTIELPHLQPILPPGPGLEAVEVNCVVCHSPRLITDQPDFSREQWAEIVHKMVGTFGAHVTADDQDLIIDYLTFIKGTDTSGDGQ